jgi:hypothetical protein
VSIRLRANKQNLLLLHAAIKNECRNVYIFPFFYKWCFSTLSVDNVVKFDAVRAFLKELDVTLSVWIGLRRQDNLHRFLWT